MVAVAKRDSMEAVTDGLATKLKDTQLETSAKTGPLGLIDLPPSVRNNIYKYALDTELVNVGKPNVSYSHSIKDGLLQFKASRSPFPVDTALFYVNKQICKEALQYFYSKNLFVRFEVYTPDARHAKTMIEDSGLLFSTAVPEQLEKSIQHAVDLTIVEKNSSQKRATVMFPAQYLPRLINFLDQASRATTSWAPMHSLFINVLNTYDFPVSRLQGDLLELFRLLHNLGAATIDSQNLLPRYAQGLQSSITASTFKAEAWLSSLTEMLDLASDARERHQYDLAHQYSQSVIIATTYGFLTRGEQLHSQPETFLQKVQRLRWRTELSIGITLSQQHESITTQDDWLSNTSTPLPEKQKAAKALLDAETATSHALSLATDSPSPNSNPWFKSLPVELIPPNKPSWFSELEQAQTWYVLGTVHMALGEVLFAAGDLERACGMWGEEDQEGKERAESAFKKAREGIDWMVKPGTGLKKAMKVARSEE